MNGYACANNNPGTFTDPDGKFCGSLLGIILAIVRAVTALLNQGGGDTVVAVAATATSSPPSRTAR
ncbi:hypothetical protein GCM10023193_45580 [Planotetraspora kaengkrachanensis]|uniref:RHS repeat-associated core domain-containing protein n=2 Tax=Planotetraspora kaengkrachanensis TaxID=575193 RepID=A0A8J3Q0I3_9ACTN|nr:hypothetical protein Pka01_73880 [Planotetraspora kaengkrachanensis]